MKGGSSRTLVGLLLLACIWPSLGHAAAALGAKPNSHQVTFRNDDLHAERVARKALRKEFGQEEDIASESNLLRTAWVDVSRARPAALFVMDGCSPTGNCGLYGFEPTKSGWKLVLNSVAQTCSILPTSHGGRRDISAYMHGSATDGTIKTYWWRRSRYVRVSERDIFFK